MLREINTGIVLCGLIREKRETKVERKSAVIKFVAKVAILL
jgi:hypothetical protein